MTVKVRGREVGIAELSMSQYAQVAEWSDALEALAKAERDGKAEGSAVTKWRALAAPLVSTARMMAPSLTDAEVADCSLRELLSVCVAGWRLNSAGKLMDEVAGTKEAAPNDFATIEAQAEGFANLAAMTGGGERANKIRRHLAILKEVERLHPGSVLVREANG